MSELALRLERVFRYRSSHLYLDVYIFNHYGFPREQILIFSDLLRANLEKPTHSSQTAPVEIIVCVTAD